MINRPALLSFFLTLGSLAGGAWAQQVAWSGSMGGKAVLIIDGQPRTLSVGASHQGVTLVSLNASEAVVDVRGQRRQLTLGSAAVKSSRAEESTLSSSSQIILSAAHGGHFMTQGSINGRSVQFMVDTGASMVALSESEAIDIGIDWRKGQRIMVRTANGTTTAYMIKLDRIRIQDVQVYNVDATVVPSSMPFVLLGNSFLNQFQMKRENDRLTLDKRL